MRPSGNPTDRGAAPQPRRRVACFVNGIYSNQIGGGDTYFFHIARAIIESGHPVHFLGGHAFREFLVKKDLPVNLTLTDGGKWRFGTASTLGEQLRLLVDFARRLWGTLLRLGTVERADIAYGMSDFWFDAIPLTFCRAHAKVMYLGMMAPTLRQVIFRTRPDVPASRLASLYYWASQQLAWRLFRLCRNAIATYSHPEMKDYLLRFGYREEQLALVPNGMDVSVAERVPEQPKEYDVVWTGRVHPQKGIEDLLATLAHLTARIEGFRAVIIGNSRAVLEPRVKDMGLERHVTFTGIVTEEEKFRVIKSSRLFLMPSRYESWGIVVGEALASGVPVLAYDLSCYRPVFGDLVRYVECFNLPQFQAAAEDAVRNARSGKLAPD
ncbi:MAG: glycosyltransferase family 4 protein, partial [Verrucomicrobiae bacterium]|nr:glycosyltransferase family 4 protein [Verrucomicrobiae bacterium]